VRKVSALVEPFQILWRAKKSWGPDVEMILPLPIVVAVESKNTFGQALEDFDQIIGYRTAKKYDAVILRVERRVERDREELELVLEQASKLGIGVVVNGYSYSPLMGAEKVLARACLDLASDPGELIREMQPASQILRMPLDRLLVFREFFKVRSCG
jgi:hypothetical protein